MKIIAICDNKENAENFTKNKMTTKWESPFYNVWCNPTFNMWCNLTLKMGVMFDSWPITVVAFVKALSSPLTVLTTLTSYPNLALGLPKKKTEPRKMKERGTAIPALSP